MGGLVQSRVKEVNMIIRPYLIVPRLIPQPTWGGTYIVDYKGLPQESLKKLLIGQSYELVSDSSLSTATRSTTLPVEIANASDGMVQEMLGDKDGIFSLRALVDENPMLVLGKRVISKHKNQMQVLIKFTQAKGNSFQVHVRSGMQLGSWKPKPESWYFFEKGKVTLGLKQPIRVAEYKDVCLSIAAKATEVASKINTSNFTMDAARNELKNFIAAHSPYVFVNELTANAHTVVDLSSGGIHHSWEEGEEIPNGNIVYEVQLNVMDKDCTLRSFDKGKINDDGNIRSVHVDDYFQALDTDEASNNPSLYMRMPMFHSDGGLDAAPLFDSFHYKSSLLSFSREYRGIHASTSEEESFAHLFIKEGNVELQAKQYLINANKGSSIFVPASTGEYTLRSLGHATIIKTWV